MNESDITIKNVIKAFVDYYPKIISNRSGIVTLKEGESIGYERILKLFSEYEIFLHENLKIENYNKEYLEDLKDLLLAKASVAHLLSRFAAVKNVDMTVIH